jgi:hypothetical protein
MTEAVEQLDSLPTSLVARPFCPALPPLVILLRFLSLAGAPRLSALGGLGAVQRF